MQKRRPIGAFFRITNDVFETFKSKIDDFFGLYKAPFFDEMEYVGLGPRARSRVIRYEKPIVEISIPVFFSSQFS